MPVPVLYTTVEAIRSTLGLDENDVSNTIIIDQNLDLQMILALDRLGLNHELYATSGEVNEIRLTLWCQYFGALNLLEVGALGIPSKFQANNDSIERFQVKMKELADVLRQRIRDLQLQMVPPTVSVLPVLLGASVPTHDPITG